jgi:uncharacterized protein YkwD
LARRASTTVATICALLALAGVVPGGANASRRRLRASRAAAHCAGAALAPTPNDLAAVDAATLCLVDRVRAAHGLPALRANVALAAAAARKVGRMLHLDYFADADPAHLTPLSLATSYAARTHAVTVGQNIAWGTGIDATPASVVERWMQSPPHREIMLAPGFRDAGVAASPAVPSVLSSTGGATYAMELGVRVR